MRQSRDGVTQIVDHASRLGRGAGAGVLPRWNWTGALVWYMRTLAWVWIGKGLFEWAIILGAVPSLGDFSRMTLPLQASIVVFACLDFLAAIGLWLAAAWGGAIWLLCTVVEAASPVLGLRAAPIGVFGALLNVALVAGYFFLSWQAARERR